MKRNKYIALIAAVLFSGAVLADDTGHGNPGNGIDAVPPENTETAQNGDSLLRELLEAFGFTNE